MLIASSTPATPDFILPNGTIIIELLLFLVVLGLVNALVLKPVQRVIAEREDKVRASLSASDSSQHEAEALEQERRSVLDSARHEARRVLEDAARQAEELREGARHDGQVEHDRLLREANSEIDGQREAVRAEVLANIDVLVCEAAGRVVGMHIDPSRHRELIGSTITASASGGRQA